MYVKFYNIISMYVKFFLQGDTVSSLIPLNSYLKAPKQMNETCRVRNHHTITIDNIVFKTFECV